MEFWSDGVYVSTIHYSKAPFFPFFGSGLYRLGLYQLIILLFNYFADKLFCHFSWFLKPYCLYSSQTNESPKITNHFEKKTIFIPDTHLCNGAIHWHPCCSLLHAPKFFHRNCQIIFFINKTAIKLWFVYSLAKIKRTYRNLLHLFKPWRIYPNNQPVYG